MQRALRRSRTPWIRDPLQSSQDSFKDVDRAEYQQAAPGASALEELRCAGALPYVLMPKVEYMKAHVPFDDGRLLALRQAFGPAHYAPSELARDMKPMYVRSATMLLRPYTAR
jgi:hypothetical protein